MGLFTSVNFKSILFLGLILCAAFIWIVGTRKTDTKKLHVLQLDTHSLQVEIADSSDEITLGLSYRSKLGSDGLLFMLPNRSVPAFWMKGMRFPLDFVWIDGNTVVDLTSNVPIQATTTDSELILYRPKVAVTQVLELNAGTIDSLGIKVGDSVHLE